MVDRILDKEDIPAFVTKVTRGTKNNSSPLRTTVVTSAASITKRPLSSKNSEPRIEPAPVKFEDQLPTFEQYELYRTGRNPYLCIECEKSFSRSSINSHVRSKHKGKNVRVQCLFCNKKFGNHLKAQGHATSEHKVYKCIKPSCKESFSEFEKLKNHLKTSHLRSQWPWICGFCDQVLFFELEFQVHIKRHTESGPYSCPLCPKKFSDNSKLSDHLSESHLSKSSEEEKNSVTSKTDSSETLHQRRESCSKENCSKDNFSMKDENAVNREIAALLLNLHSSRSAPKVSSPPITIPKPEDLSIKSFSASSDAAMDLTKAKSPISLPIINTPMPATITKLVKSQQVVDLSSKSAIPAPAVSNTSTCTQSFANFSIPTASSSFPMYPSLATMATLSPSLAINSNYLLQNLLLGKMQQIVSASSATVAQPSMAVAKTNTTTLSVPATSLPTQPLPAQTLTLPASGSLKPPPAVFKTTSVPHSSSGGSAPNFTNPMVLTSGVGGEINTTTVTPASPSNIPLLCGQIVSQLNGLLFLVHGMNSPSLEMNLQTQLTAIHSRLQEIVSMVELAKKSDLDLKGQVKDEDKIVAKHIQDYQRALLKQHEDGSKQVQKNLIIDAPEVSPNDLMEHQEAESTSGHMSAAARRRRGRPPKNSNLDLSYSPPEKQMRSSPANRDRVGNSVDLSSLNVHQQVNGEPPLINGHIVANSMQTGQPQVQAPSTGKGSKGIRNRVFCGECGGCLKNDDCGKCRYCKDKTKFGGQNRLRQKCLHRRCQMDTHRRRSSHGGQAAANAAAISVNVPTLVGNLGEKSNESKLNFEAPRHSPSPNGILSGVDLARLAAAGQHQVQSQQVIHQLSPDQAVVHHPAQEPEPTQDHEPDRSASSASNGSSCDDDGDDQKSGKTQSRISKWKAKHEAMLKLAQKSDQTGKVGDEQSGDNHSELLDLAASAPNVCMNFETKDSKPHTSHTTSLQVLSV